MVLELETSSDHVLRDETNESGDDTVAAASVPSFPITVGIIQTFSTSELLSSPCSYSFGIAGKVKRSINVLSG